VKLLGYIGLTARRWQNQNRDRQNAALIWTRAESLMSAPDPVAITLQQHCARRSIRISGYRTKRSPVNMSTERAR